MYSESFVTKSHISKALHVCNRYPFLNHTISFHSFKAVNAEAHALILIDSGVLMLPLM